MDVDVEVVACDHGVRVLVAEPCGAKLSRSSRLWNGGGRSFQHFSQNGTLTAKLTLGHSVIQRRLPHFATNYQAGAQTFEAPTLRVNPGTLNLTV